MLVNKAYSCAPLRWTLPTGHSHPFASARHASLQACTLYHGTGNLALLFSVAEPENVF